MAATAPIQRDPTAGTTARVEPPVAGFKIADPAPLGLAGFAMTTFVLSMFNANLVSEKGTPVVLGLALAYGGIVQLLAGMWEFRNGNTFGAVAFSSFGAFWISFWALNVFYAKDITGNVGHAIGLYLWAWAIFTAYMTVAALRVSAAVLLVFVLLTATFVLLAIGAVGRPRNRHPLGRLHRARDRHRGLVRLVRGRRQLDVRAHGAARGPAQRRARRGCGCRVPAMSVEDRAASGEELDRELAGLLDVERFPPPAAFAEHALLKDPAVYERAAADPQAWWVEQAEQLHWFSPWEQVLDDSNPPFYEWFTGGKLNVSYNCLDRHVEAGRGERIAYHWRGEDGTERDITYSELLAEVKRFASALKELGVGKGDVVGIYLPMIPEVVVAMLACARIGAPHNVVFGGLLRRGGPRADGVLRGEGPDHG